jgi:predicted chitinase
MLKLEWGLPVVLRMFPEAHARANATRYFPLVEQALHALALRDAPMKVFVYATVRAETAGFASIGERKSPLNTLKKVEVPRLPSQGLRDIAAISNHIVGQLHLDDRFGYYNHRMGNTERGDAERYRGRGFVQLTGKDNYAAMATRLRLPELLSNPDLALDPAVAARILARFVKDREPLIRHQLALGHLRQARKLVNGGTHGMTQFEGAWRLGMSLITPADRPDLSHLA